ncbi:MAG: flippase-like domain-containing protein [Rhodobacteraceae bacterium]|nr:flippase-like domain-containing protein [Paracoccaceae bacterium]
MTGTHPYRSSLIVLAIFVACAGLAAATASGEDIWRQVTQLSIAQVLILLGLSLINYTFRAFRWYLYTGALNIKLSFWQVLRHYLGGFALTMTPGRIGELVRVRWIGKEAGATVERTAPLALIDRAADLASSALLLAFSLMIMTGGISGGVPVVILALLAAVVATRPRLFRWMVTRIWRLIGRKPRLFARLRRASHSLKPFSQAHVALPALALGFIGWFAEGYAFYLLLDWMGAPLPVWTCVGIFVFAMMTGGLTGMPGGVGGAEAAMLALLSLKGVPLEIGIPATAIIRVTTLWFAIGLGLLFFPIAETAAARKSHALERN